MTISLDEWVKAVNEANRDADGYTSAELARALNYQVPYFRNIVLPRLIQERKVRLSGKRGITRSDGTAHRVYVYELLSGKTRKKTV